MHIGCVLLTGVPAVALPFSNYHKRRLFSDGDGRSIGVDATQGDLADSTQTNFFGKFGWEPTAVQRLQFTINKFDLKGDGDWSSVPGDRDAGIPVTSRRGAPEGEPALHDGLTMSLAYTHRDRKRAVRGKGVAVGVDIGGWRSINK